MFGDDTSQPPEGKQSYIELTKENTRKQLQNPLLSLSGPHRVF